MPCVNLLFLLCLVLAWSAQAVGSTLVGRIIDAANSTPLVGAYLIVEGTRLGAVTDSSGAYSIAPIAPGSYRLVAEMLGYKAEIVRDVVVFADSTTRADIALVSQSIELNTVTVTGRRQRSQAEQQTSAHQLEARQVVALPGGGEDLFRSLHALPGVVARADFASQFYVRGGTPDQNLIVVDGVPVFNPLSPQATRWSRQYV